MEKTGRASVIALDAGWSDVGSWAALHEVSPKDDAGNSMVGDVVAVNCRDSYVRSESRLVGVVGLEGCVVVETKDAVMVAPRERAQEVKALVEERLPASGPSHPGPRGVPPLGQLRQPGVAAGLPGEATGRPAGASFPCSYITGAPSTGWWCRA